MIKLFFQKYRTRIIMLMGLLTFIAVIMSLASNSVSNIQLATSIPTNNSQSVGLTAPIRASFNQEVDANLLKITSVPEESWTVKNLDSQTILIEHKLAYSPYTDYSVSISLDNKLIGKVDFTTIKAQGDLRSVQTIQEQMKIDYPLSKILPHETLAFKAVYSAPLTLEITLKNINLTSEEVIEEMKAWVTQNGGDAAAHKFIIAAP